MNPAQIPAELRALKQWVCWQRVTRPGQEKPTKVPKNATGNAATTRPEDWMTFDEARAVAAEKHYDGVGFVFTKDDPYVGVDLDGMLDPKTLQLTPAAQDIVHMLSPAYVEISQSGKGVHVIVKGSLPAGARRKGPIESYSEARYFAITGDIMAGSSTTVPDRTTELAAFHAKYLSGGDVPPAEGQEPSQTTKASESDIAAVLDRIEMSPDGRAFNALF